MSEFFGAGYAHNQNTEVSAPPISYSGVADLQQVPPLGPPARPLPLSPKAKEIISFRKQRIQQTVSMDTGEHQWVIDAKLLKPMIMAKNQEKFISPKFKMSHLTWQIEAYPNGNTPATTGSFNLYLRLISIPKAWKNITICRTFTCNETKSGYTAVSRYEKSTSLGWPDFNLSLQDIKNRLHWIKQLTFTINVKILQIRLFKGDGELFYESRVDPYRALKKQTISWKLDENLLHEMKQAYHKKGFVSPIYNNMWCLRCYPNGKQTKGDFLVQLQLCGLPVQADRLNVKWTIKCQDAKVSAGWTTNFDFSQSCWGWGNEQLSFAQFKQCELFTISVDVYVDDKVNVIAMAEWEKYVRKQQVRHSLNMSDLREYAALQFKKTLELEEKKDSDLGISALNESQTEHNMIGVTRTSVPPPPCPPSPSKMSNASRSLPAKMFNEHISEQGSQDLHEWLEKRLKIQDDVLEELTKEIDMMKVELERLKKERSPSAGVGGLGMAGAGPSYGELKKQITAITKTVNRLKRAQNHGHSQEHDGDAAEMQLSEKERLRLWLEDTVKLPQYFDVLVAQGFDELDAMQDITKDDLNQMGIDKVGHQRKIIKNAQQII